MTGNFRQMRFAAAALPLTLHCNINARQMHHEHQA
jgi:hypothetical protein